jgi:outer membrane protein assembly factor BamC
VKRFPAVPSARLSALSLAVVLAGCSSLNDITTGDKVDYRTTTGKTQPLDVPPDLTQLARDSRYQPQGGVISAAASTTGATAAAVAPRGPTVAPLSRGDIRVERDGSERWLVVPMTPEQLWPLLKSFWLERGFTLAVENPESGVMETNWSENRAKLPPEAVRNTIGRMLGNVYDTGERDLFRTRVERTATGSEVYISHRGVAEVYTDALHDNTTWKARPNDPQLEAEFLSRLMARLGTPEEAAQTAVAAAAPPELPARARAVGTSGTVLEVDESFDRAWRRVGLALDRSGFTVEDRDRAGGLYFVRYVDPKNVDAEEPGFFARLFGTDKNASKGLEHYRIAVKASGEKTQVSVLNGSGAPDSGATGQRIAATLVKELR